ncbi:hypothetical protein J2S53_002818 [Actinopolyspora lacussalsi]|nr:hypothetical protein [Actinopolyspora lacussalsi]
MRARRGIDRLRGSSWTIVGIAVVFAAGILSWTPVNALGLLAHAVGTLTSSGLFRLPGLITLVSGILLIALAASRLRTRLRQRNPADNASELSGAPVRPIPGWAIWVGLAVLVTVGAAAAVLLVSAFGSGSEQDRVRLDAIKLAGSIAVGTGGAAALVLAARKQRATELGVIQQEQAQRLQERKAEQAKHDADERRVTELYTAAAQQLASENAPVRMAGLYALSRLGQNNPDHRQTIVNLFCAYLRMPYTPPDVEETSSQQESGQARRLGLRSPERVRQGSSPLATLLTLAPTLAAAGSQLTDDDYQRQELQVRLTAQRLLVHHLHPQLRKEGERANGEFWEGMIVNLADAALFDWDFSYCQVSRVEFASANFYGSADFSRAKLDGAATFSGARFHDEAEFVATHFDGSASFEEVQFDSSAAFVATRFYDVAVFDSAKFFGQSMFTFAQFYKNAGFVESRFYRDADFVEAFFLGSANFALGWFHGAALFGRDKNDKSIDPVKEKLQNNVEFSETYARLDYDSYFESAWPTGWVIREFYFEDGSGERWGEIVRE